MNCGLALPRSFALALLACVGCDAPLCRELESRPVTSSASGSAGEERVQRGSARLVEAGQEISAEFVAALSGLPEVWEPDGSVQRGLVRLDVVLRYEQEPFGSDGKTQMPRLALDLLLDQEPAAQPFTTPMFPHPASLGVSRSLFTLCTQSWMTSCCPRGARECAHPIRVRIERLDGTPFPAVVVDWSLRVSASVSDCPGDGEAELELAEAEP